ncbi:MULTISPECIES: MurR/RpiR family transcriptional regulator [unclassified Oceanobacillus]|uniref:MurR/RpiR family transcriptional regulator n=1 Tax=unclassified Oceanobacillus TaxID=2630292 RepID=UPI0012EC6DEF|nr:MurR/RpiR family transcriptional regulator [Oceanobacillus sp. AG]
MSLFEKIQVSLETLSEAKKRVAYYVLDNWLEAAFLPASKVAKNAKASESVVVRFSQDLGFSGFPDFQKELQKILKSRLAYPANEQISASKDFKNINADLLNVYNKSLENIDDVFKNNSINMFVKFINKIKDAARVLILARQNSYGPAYTLNVHLNELFGNSKIMDGESVESLDYIRKLNDKDLVLFISIPSYSKRMRLYSDYLNEKGIPQVAITNSHSNNIGKNAEVLLLTSVDSHSYSNSHIGTVFIIDILIYLFTLENKAELLKYIEDTKLLNERFGITD